MNYFHVVLLPKSDMDNPAGGSILMLEVNTEGHRHCTWSNSCLPVVLGWMANSSSASTVVTRTLTCGRTRANESSKAGRSNREVLTGLLQCVCVCMYLQSKQWPLCFSAFLRDESHSMGISLCVSFFCEAIFRAPHLTLTSFRSYHGQIRDSWTEERRPQNQAGRSLPFVFQPSG